MKKILLAPDHFLAMLVIGLIKIYQRTISPDHSNLGKTQPLTGCKFYPSCSEYSIQVLQKQGFVLGIFKILWRTLRCHPWSKGGVDLPLNKN